MPAPTIVRHVARPSRTAVETLTSLGVATVHEAQQRTGLVHPSVRPIYLDAKAGGPAITVSCHPGDNLMIHAAIEVCREGDILVVVTTSESSDGMFGELLAESARAHGVAGLVITAGVRDVADLIAMRFPVWARAISAQGTVKATAGSVNVPIVCAGALITPGDVVVGDADGVVVVKRDDADTVAAAAAARRDKEAATREQLKSGVLGLDLYGLRTRLAALGVRYVDAPQ